MFYGLVSKMSIYRIEDGVKKAISDLRLTEKATVDFNKYADGTTHRISFSSLINMDSIKYWINVQNLLIALRWYDVQGSAALSTYEIEFSENDILSGSAGVNSTYSNDTVYRKIISDSGFDFNNTNCDFKGFIVDYLKRINDISDNYSIDVGGASAPNAYDDDLTSFAGQYSSPSSATTVWEVSFPAVTISNIHASTYIQWHSGLSGDSYASIQIYDGSWHTIFTQSGNGTVYLHNNALSYTISKIRVVADPTGDRSQYTKIYDISVF